MSGWNPKVRKIAWDMMSPERRREFLLEEQEEEARQACRDALPAMSPEDRAYWQQRLAEGTVKSWSQ